MVVKFIDITIFPKIRLKKRKSATVVLGHEDWGNIPSSKWLLQRFIIKPKPDEEEAWLKEVDEALRELK